MIDPDKYYGNVETFLVNKLKSTGEVENSFWQHIGKIYNHTISSRGYLFDEMTGNIERMLTGKHKHGFEQNKKTDIEKLQEKGREESNG